MSGFKKLLTPLLLVYVLGIAYCQSYEVKTSPGVETKFTSMGHIIISYINSNKKIELVSNLPLRSILLSGTKEYIAITSGEDLVGRIQIFDNNNHILIDEGYSGKWPLWENNKIRYEAVLWQGEGFTVREKHTFDNGVLSRSKQYIGEYHGFGDEIVDPLCPNYKLNMYSNLNVQIGLLKETIEYWEQKMKLPKSGIDEMAILKNNSINQESIIELVEKDVEINNKMVYVDDNQFYSMKIFNHICIIVGKAFQENLINIETKNTTIKKMLISMRIDYDIAPWLYLE
jgi:hypothetical protein